MNLNHQICRLDLLSHMLGTRTYFYDLKYILSHLIELFFCTYRYYLYKSLLKYVFKSEFIYILEQICIYFLFNYRFAHFSLKNAS